MPKKKSDADIYKHLDAALQRLETELGDAAGIVLIVQIPDQQGHRGTFVVHNSDHEEIGETLVEIGEGIDDATIDYKSTYART